MTEKRDELLEDVKGESGFSEVKIYAVSNDVSPDWMNKYSLQACIDEMYPNGGAIVEEDLTDEFAELKSKYMKLKSLILLVDSDVSGVIVGPVQVVQWSSFVNAFPDEALEKEGFQ